jgi:hypothetical protein
MSISIDGCSALHKELSVLAVQIATALLRAGALRDVVRITFAPLKRSPVKILYE